MLLLLLLLLLLQPTFLPDFVQFRLNNSYMEVRLGGSEVQHKRRRVITRFFGGLIPGLNLVQKKQISPCDYVLFCTCDIFGCWQLDKRANVCLNVDWGHWLVIVYMHLRLQTWLEHFFSYGRVVLHVYFNIFISQTRWLKLAHHLERNITPIHFCQHFISLGESVCTPK